MPTIIQWVKRLEAKIEEQQTYAKPFEQRYANEYVLPFIAQEYREVYGASADNLLKATLEAPRTGSAAIGVDALAERLTLLGCTSDDKDTEKAVNDAWEDNDLDVMHRHGHLEALIRSAAFGVLSRATDGRRAILTIESTEQAAVHRMQGPPYDVDAYFKRWADEWTGKWHGELRLPGRVIPMVRSDIVAPDPEGSEEWSNWTVAGDERPSDQQVQVVAFEHQPRLLKPPASEIERVTTLVDLVDLIEGLMVFAGHFGAVPIRYAEGWKQQRDPKDPTMPLLDPKTGKPYVGFNPRADHMWFGGEGVKFGQLTPATLDTFVTWANHARANLRTATKVASTYYALDLKSHMSAELLKVDEAPMVRRISGIGRKGTFNQAWRRWLTQAARMEGHSGRVKPLWEDENTRLEAQAVDAFQKAVASGIGVVTAAEKFLGWSRTDAQAAVEEAREEQRAAAEAIAAQATDPFELLDPATRATLKALPGGLEPSATGS
ncbi:hypothetical protein [Nocardioides sp. R-C-SC26]|uniref:hypothetical protein n=1 Tax=Nocardioides sp. R-C-SC26 TaxID=2870414 RepID=UPI001E2ADFC3|nr:hypothetical protein [Nocardioides sp. R-C-SC26]